MGKQTNHLRELAGRYRAGVCTPEEIKQINEWYDGFEEDGYPLPMEYDVERASNEAFLRAVRQVSLQERNGKIRRLLMPALKVAAVLAVVCSAALLLYKRNDGAPVVLYREVSALAGEKKRISLSDGSVVFVNSASSIRFPVEFIGHTREVYLKGEAFFEVSHKKEHPFIVHAEKLKIQVLGTSFGVKAYHPDEQMEVAVATGKVGVMPDRKSKGLVWMLTPGQQLRYSKATGQFSREQVLISDIKNWQQNILVFNFETLEDITRKLERVYAVKFTFKDRSLLKKRFQLKVENETLSNILKLLSISGDGFKYHITGRQVIIG